MSVAEMRRAIGKVYDGEKWKEKVRNMSDAQVTAIYYKMINAGQIKRNTYNPYKLLKY